MKLINDYDKNHNKNSGEVIHVLWSKNWKKNLRFSTFCPTIGIKSTLKTKALTHKDGQEKQQQIRVSRYSRQPFYVGVDIRNKTLDRWSPWRFTWQLKFQVYWNVPKCNGMYESLLKRVEFFHSSFNYERNKQISLRVKVLSFTKIPCFVAKLYEMSYLLFFVDTSSNTNYCFFKQPWIVNVIQ